MSTVRSLVYQLFRYMGIGLHSARAIHLIRPLLADLLDTEIDNKRVEIALKLEEIKAGGSLDPDQEGFLGALLYVIRG